MLSWLVKLTFLGAAGTVTGSRYLLDVRARHILVDCGLFQGRKEIRQRNWERLPFDPRGIHAVLLTHAHVDHCAFLPVIVREGFSGPIYATPPTIDLARLVLQDSAHIQEEEASYANRKGYSRHHPALPLYTAADAERAMERLRPLGYREAREIVPGVAATFGDAGHILGSANLRLQIDGRHRISVAFSGDIGRYAEPLLNDPEPIREARWIVCESTYGDRIHERVSDFEPLANAVEAIVERGGVMVIPAFAIGRTQTILFGLRELVDRGRIPMLPVYLDSPMAVRATRIFGQHPKDHDVEARALMADGTPPLEYPDLRIASTREESEAINKVDGPAVIISASGMATGGRVLHHLRQRLPERRNMVVLVGFQADGTRGRALQDGAGEIKMHGSWVPVRAEIRTLPGFSAHADREEILRWLRGFESPPNALYLTHGENGARTSLADFIRGTLGWKVHLPEHLEVVSLSGEA